MLLLLISQILFFGGAIYALALRCGKYNDVPLKRRTGLLIMFIGFVIFLIWIILKLV